ncbi:unnamed protein product [Symbiodinium sp. CCMP2592]|nr:unnamed protein product [Symbiodinium sp. CCMP2592]
MAHTMPTPMQIGMAGTWAGKIGKKAGKKMPGGPTRSRGRRRECAVCCPHLGQPGSLRVPRTGSWRPKPSARAPVRARPTERFKRRQAWRSLARAGRKGRPGRRKERRKGRV